MDNYILKYLKYKNKYLDLKKYLNGGSKEKTDLSKNESRFIRSLISFLRHDELINKIKIDDSNKFSPGKIKKRDVIINFKPEEVPFIRIGSFGSTSFRGLYIPTLLRIIKETPFQFGGKFFRVEKGIKNPCFNEFLELEKFTQLMQMLSDESSNSRIIYDNKNLVLAITSGVSVNNSIFKLLFKDPDSTKVIDTELLLNFPKYGIKSDGNILHASEYFLPSQKPPFDGTMKPMDRSLHVIICSGDIEIDFKYVNNKVSSGGKWKNCRYFYYKTSR